MSGSLNGKFFSLAVQVCVFVGPTHFESWQAISSGSPQLLPGHVGKRSLNDS